ncbi:MAG TPA: ABC transporter ATP-binding protein [candidate division Zixibacteria bacterium]|nr:ABC transporter ATP-binding protein [candidate division Zixibacteria bacterium]
MRQSTEKNRKTQGRFSTVTKYLKEYRGYLIAGAFCILATNALSMTIPYITKIVFDLLERHGSDSERLRWVLILFGLSILAGIFRFLMRRTVIWASRKIEYRLRGEIFGHLLKLSPSYYDTHRTGDIMVRLTNDLEAVRMMIGPGIMHISSTILTFIIAVIFMVNLSPTLTLYSLVPMIFVPLAVYRIGNLVHIRAMRIQDHFSELTATVQENIAGIRVVKAFRQEESETENFRDMSSRYLDLNMDMARLQATLNPLIMALAATLGLVVLYFGGRDVINHDIPLGTLVAFFAYLSMLFWPAIAFGWVVSLYQRGTASLDRINTVLRTEPEIRDNGKEAHRGKIKGKIEFRHLSFSYEDNLVLNDIDLTVEAGETIGLVGMTGSGKTTLVSLLARLYPSARGKLLIDGVDINDWELESLRNQIGFATQEPFLFSRNIAENVAFGAELTDPDEVSQAADTAALVKDIEMFPSGYETMLGERGITLSGGQKQRTAIARALLIDPAILVLDDATSSVDTETEDEINEKIKAVLSGRTAIVISHRVSSVKEADKIIYLENGRIVEMGNHDQLIAKDGRYAELYRAQLMAQELDKL